MACDFLNREQLAHHELPQDLLYLLTLYGEALANAIRAADGALVAIGPEGILALFGLEGDPARAAGRALRAAGAIERAISELDTRLGREGDDKVRITVSIHAGRAAVGEVGSTDPPAVVAVGAAVDVANELRKAAAAHGQVFAISEPVTAAAGVAAAAGERVVLRMPGSGAPIAAWLSGSSPVAPPPRSRLEERRAALRRLWSG
jgi:adenylate cyclase